MGYGRRKTGKGKKGYRRRRAYRKRRGATTMVSSLAPIADRYVTKLRYVEGNSLTYTASTEYNSYQYRLNSIYDPNYTGVGHQPLGHDELATLYNRYRVVGCSYKVVMTNRSTTYEGEVSVQLRPNMILSTLFSTVQEGPYSQTRTLCNANAGGSVCTIRGYIPISKIRGVVKNVVKSDDTYQAQFGANPSITPALNIYVRNQNTTANCDFAWRIYLTYHVICYDRKDLGQS